MSRPFSTAILLFAIVVLAPPASQAVDVDSPYGVVAFIPSPTRWDAMRDADIVWGRCGFSWREIETAKGVFNWRIDEVNASGTAAGAVWSFRTWGSLADFNWDGDVDQADFGHLQACLSGAGVMYGPGCQDADLVVDNAIDGADLGWFLSCLNGAGQRPGR